MDLNIMRCSMETIDKSIDGGYRVSLSINPTGP